jgi:hypothetical protein
MTGPFGNIFIIETSFNGYWIAQFVADSRKEINKKSFSEQF